jgi:hypothetical protein
MQTTFPKETSTDSPLGNPQLAKKDIPVFLWFCSSSFLVFLLYFSLAEKTEESSLSSV